MTRQLREMAYQVIEGGRVQDDIIVNGRIVGGVSWTAVEIDGGGDPMMDQVQGFNGEVEAVTTDGIDVYYLRFPEATSFAAYWWEPGHDRCLTVFVSEEADLQPLTEALIAQ